MPLIGIEPTRSHGHSGVCFQTPDARRTRHWEKNYAFAPKYPPKVLHIWLHFSDIIPMRRGKLQTNGPYQGKSMRLQEKQDLDRIREQSRKLVSRRSLISAGAAVVPIPGVDVGTDVAILMKLLPAINEKFGLTPSQIDELSPELQKIVIVGGASMGLGLIGKALTVDRIISLLARLGAKRIATKSVIKYVPFVGSAISATISYYLLRKIGNAHIDECYELVRKMELQKAREEVMHRPVDIQQH